MNHRLIPAVVLSAALLSGCVSSHPQTAQKFREAVPGAFLVEVETFEVKRPSREVAKTFQKKGPQCLQVAIQTTEQGSMHYQSYTTTYTPTVVINGDRAELHLQQHVDNTVKVTEEPEDGYYLLVADATPVNKSTTRIDIYRPSVGYDVLIESIRGWASGKNLGCPDMTKT